MEIVGASEVRAARRETSAPVDLEVKPLGNDNQLWLSGAALTGSGGQSNTCAVRPFRVVTQFDFVDPVERTSITPEPEAIDS